MADEPAAPAEEPKAPDESADAPVQRDDDWQAKARKHERDLKKERTAREALEAKLAEHAAANQTETEKAIEKARKEAAAETETKVSAAFKERILNAEVRAQAAQKFANPTLAPKLLDLDADALFDSDGDLDTKAIARAVDDFLKQDENAGLRVDQSGRPVGDADAGKGAGGASRTPAQQHDDWLAGLLRQP